MFLFLSVSAGARVLRVGPAETLTLPSQAAAVAQHGDTIEIAAGSYTDCATWNHDNLLIRGIGGYAHVRDRACGGKAIWVIRGRNTTVEWIEFSGATVPDRNGAGIRQEGVHLTVRHCRFHDNENGILAGDNVTSSILIEFTEFDRNGYGDGYSHNMYINHVKEFEIRYSHVRRARIGHNIKSRAHATRVIANLITSEADGTNSRAIDVPNGGDVLVLGNAMHHGPRTNNSNVIGYGLEGLSNPSPHTLVVASNTIVSERGGSFVSTPALDSGSVTILNNLLVGGSAIWTGQSHVRDIRTSAVTTLSAAAFLDAAAYDYRLRSASIAVNAAPVPARQLPSPLVPRSEYQHPLDRRVRVDDGVLDAGAFEFVPLTEASPPPVRPSALTIDDIWPHPASLTRDDVIRLKVTALRDELLRITVTDLLGRAVAVRETHMVTGAWIVAAWDLRDGTGNLVMPGVYHVGLSAGAYSATRSVVVVR